MPKYGFVLKISAVIFLVGFSLVGCHGANNGSSAANPSAGSAPAPSMNESGPAAPPAPVTPGATETFDQQLTEAENLLATTTTGALSLADFNSLESNGNIDSVTPVLTVNQYGHSGSVHEISSGIYQIRLLATLSIDDLAQELAHEVVHVKNEVAIDAYFVTNPDLDARFAGIAKHWDSTLAAYYTANKDDVDFFFQSLVFEEVKAYQRNLQLDKEGIPFHNAALKSQGLLAYIQNAYSPSGVSLTPLPSDFLQTVAKYDTVADFEKANAKSAK